MMVAFFPPCVMPAFDDPATVIRVAVGLLAAMAAFKKPCGVMMMSSCRSSAKGIA